MSRFRALRRLGAAVLAVALALLTAACQRDASRQAGVAAVVNGAPILLADLEARHDLGRLGAPEADNPAVERLRAEYGAVLADMIVARLVRQELHRLGRDVTGAEVEDAAAKVRADYPGDAFERMLHEERIDPVRWREVLADRLALEKFSSEVLRQNARVDVAEAAAYYKEHIEAFTRPSRVRLAEVRGRDAETAKAAWNAFRKSGQTASLQSLDGIAVREAVVPEANLPLAWREAVKGLKAGEASAPLGTDKGSFLVLLERQPAVVLDPAQSYAQIEAALAARKRDKAFAAWLAEALAGATITVNRQLVATAGTGTDPAAEEGGPDGRDRAREEALPGTAAVAQVRQALDGKSGLTPDRQEDPPAADAPPAVLPPAVAEEVPADPVAAPPAGAAASEPEAAPAPAPEPTLPAANAPVSVPTDHALPTQGQHVPAPAADSPAEPASSPAAGAGAPAGGAGEKTGEGAVEFTAVKGSWILYTVDAGQEERVYLKPGQPHRIGFSGKLTVRLGSPSEVTYRFKNRETTVAVGKKESRILEFP